MKKALMVLAACAAYLGPGGAFAAPTVAVSLNVFPTVPTNPNGGGTWTMVAKTDSTIGIAAITAYLSGINTTGITIENDIGHTILGGNPVVFSIGGTTNITYGQDTSSGPIVAGVGTPSLSDGPDPLGDPAWDDATRIYSGTYSSTVPVFATNVGPANNNTDANVLASIIAGVAAIDADTTAVVRVAVPEPGTVALVGVALVGGSAMLRRRRPRRGRLQSSQFGADVC